MTDLVPIVAGLVVCVALMALAVVMLLRRPTTTYHETYHTYLPPDADAPRDRWGVGHPGDVIEEEDEPDPFHPEF